MCSTSSRATKRRARNHVQLALSELPIKPALLTWQTRFEMRQIRRSHRERLRAGLTTACSVRSSRACQISANHKPPSSKTRPVLRRVSVRFIAPEFNSTI